jgi:hypothetical protein
MDTFPLNAIRTLLFLCIAVFISFGQRQSETRFASAVSSTNLRKQVQDLVSYGNRLGGTASGSKAAAYVANRFKDFGLVPETVQDPEKLSSTVQSWSLSVDKPNRLRGLIQNDWLGLFSPSTKPSKARLKFWDKSVELKSVDAESSVVLVQNGVSESEYRELVRAGARAVLTFAVVNSPAYSNWSLIENLPEKTDNPIPLYSISNVAGKRLVEELHDSVAVQISFSSKTRIQKARPKTIIATLHGKSSKYFLVCAHGDGDSGGPGADDNASGVSGVLELARVFNSMIDRGQLPMPTNSIKFAVWGSEYFSTSAYVKRNADSLEQILAVLNFDEIGTGKSRNCLYFEGNDVDQNESLLRLFDSVATEYVGKRGFWSEATTNPSQGGTDSYVFLPDFLRKLDVSRVEIPSITIYSAAWNEPKRIKQTRGWNSKAWHGPKDSVVVDYSMFYHSSLDIPKFTTEKEPFNMSWAVKAVGIALLRRAW